MLLTKRASTILFLSGFLVFLLTSSMICDAKFHRFGYIIPTKCGMMSRNTNIKLKGDGPDEGEVVRPPPFPPGNCLNPPTARVLSVGRAGGAKATIGVNQQTSSCTWKSLIPWLFVWYGSSIAYGLMTKNLLKEAYYPWTVASFQMLSGLLFQLPLWYLNLQKSPELTWNDIKALIPVAICQLGVHIGATIATGIDQGLPIAHIVKAMEPILTLGLDHILLQRDAPSELLLGLIPLVAGTVLPYWTAHKFSLGAAAAAIMIVVCSSFRVVFTHKILTEKKIGKNLDSRNLFAVLSVMTSLVLIPITLQIDGLGLLYALREKSNFHSQVTMNLCISGYLFYLFNQASFTMMESLTPTTHAVANIMRRPTVTFLFFIVTAFHKLCSFISVRLIPLSFLIWDQGFRETHTLADVLRRKGEPALASRILQPSVDSLVGSIMGFGGCLIYLNEVEGEEDLDEKKLSMMAPPGRKMGRREKKSKNQDRVRFARPQ